MSRRLQILKVFTKNVVDFCVLPGTAIGAEILWIYTVQWKNRMSLLAVAMISVVYSHMLLQGDSMTSPGKLVTEPENTR